MVWGNFIIHVKALNHTYKIMGFYSKTWGIWYEKHLILLRGSIVIMGSHGIILCGITQSYTYNIIGN